MMISGLARQSAGLSLHSGASGSRDEGQELAYPHPLWVPLPPVAQGRRVEPLSLGLSYSATNWLRGQIGTELAHHSPEVGQRR